MVFVNQFKHINNWLVPNVYLLFKMITKVVKINIEEMQFLINFGTKFCLLPILVNLKLGTDAIRLDDYS